MVGGAVAPLIICNASADDRFRDHPGLHLYGIESYIAVPLVRRDGSYFGTLCALDPQPAALTQDDLALFQLLASLIAFELEADDRRRDMERDLAEERSEAETRERLIGVLGHDLRTPLTAAVIGAEALARDEALNEPARHMALTILSSARRAARMVTQLLDFARARLSGGIPIHPTATDLQRVVEKVLAEIRSAAPERDIRASVSGDCRGVWDPDRSAQVMANLIHNALQHGHADTPVHVAMVGGDDAVLFEVTNQSDPLPPAQMAELFSPSGGSRGAADGSSGLGLGLYIVQQIMRGHGGFVEATSHGHEVRVRAAWPRQS